MLVGMVQTSVYRLDLWSVLALMAVGYLAGQIDLHSASARMTREIVIYCPIQAVESCLAMPCPQVAARWKANHPTDQ